jgi:hypothetical protein
MRFELPTSITPSAISDKVMKALPGDLSTTLTDASHTAVGFATMAFKRVNDARLDVNAKYEPQVRELRKNAIGVVKTATVARHRVESAIDPVLDRAVERLPEALQDSAAELRKVSRQAAISSERRIVNVIEFATAVPTKAVRRTVKDAETTTFAKKAPAKTTAKSAPKSATKKTVKESTKKVTAKRTTKSSKKAA